MVTPGGTQTVVFINESGLYSLILSSKLPQAKAFKRWVTSEVLPQIRMTGGYIPTRDTSGRELSSEEILQRADVIVGRTLRLLNEPARDTLTATQVAKTFNMQWEDRKITVLQNSRRLLRKPFSLESADLNDDGEVDIQDLTLLIEMLTE